MLCASPGASWCCATATRPAASIRPTPGSTTARRSATWTTTVGRRPDGSARRPRCRCLDTARLAFGQAQSWEPLQGALRDAERRQQQLVEMRKAIAAHRSGPPLVLVTHGSVVTDLTGLSIRMGELVVLRRAADGTHAVAGQLYVE